MNMKRTIALFLLLASLLALPVWASDTEDVSNEGDGILCGENMSWFVDGTTLTVSGKGEMYDFEFGKAPWQDFKDSLTKVVLEDGITQVGAYAFTDFDKLTQVDFGSELVKIGPFAFSSCDGLNSISLPKTFKKFGERCFNACTGLKEIHCAGSFPRFDDSCLWDTYCKIYFPAEAPWSVILIEDLENAFQGRIEFLASDGTDPYTPTEATEPIITTAPPTETTEAPTEAETTLPVTETVTEPETTVETTAAPTEEETTADTRETFLMGATETETQKPTKEKTHSGGKMGLLLVIATLAVIGLGALVFRIANRRD